MADVENMLNNDDFFGDTADTPKEGIEQHRKRECLKLVSAIFFKFLFFHQMIAFKSYEK